MLIQISHHRYQGGVLDIQDLRAFFPMVAAYQAENNPSYDWKKDALEERAKVMLTHEHTSVFGLCEGDRLIGYFVLTGLEKDKADVYEQYIIPKYRGKKLASMLYDLCFREVVEHQEVSAAKLQMTGKNCASSGAAVREGFERVNSYNLHKGGDVVDFYEQAMGPLREFVRLGNLDEAINQKTISMPQPLVLAID